MPTYQAICPDCGATIHANVVGLIWAGCPTCPFYGQVLATAAPGAGATPVSLSQMKRQMAAKLPPLPTFSLLSSLSSLGMAASNAIPDGDDDDAADPLAARRDALQHELRELVGHVDAQITTAPDDGSEDRWNMGLWQRYERLQAAHGALFEALGGRRMGGYRADTGRVREALEEMLLWALLTLDGAQQAGV